MTEQEEWERDVKSQELEFERKRLIQKEQDKRTELTIWISLFICGQSLGFWIALHATSGTLVYDLILKGCGFCK